MADTTATPSAFWVTFKQYAIGAVAGGIAGGVIGAIVHDDAKKGAMLGSASGAVGLLAGKPLGEQITKWFS